MADARIPRCRHSLCSHTRVAPRYVRTRSRPGRGAIAAHSPTARWRPPFLLAAIAAGLLVLLAPTPNARLDVAAAQLAPARSVPLLTHAASEAPVRKGINLIIYYNDPYFESKVNQLLDSLARLGVNSVGVMLPFVQEQIDSSEVSPDASQSLSNANLAILIRAAKARGMSVMLRPVLDEQNLLQQNPQFWRGVLDPADISAWFDSYTRFLLPLATIAQKQGADMFSVGIELSSLEPYTDNWLTLIAQVRAVYSGELLYSLNWDRLTEDPPLFLDALDDVGVDAFFPLTDVPTGSLDPSVPDLAQAWTKWLGVTRAYMQDSRTPRSMIFTELGVRAQQGAFQRPYTWNTDTGPSGESQARYYDAACQATASLGLSGVYWWYTSLEPSPDMADFDPRGKPAEIEVQRCFTQVLQS